MTRGSHFDQNGVIDNYSSHATYDVVLQHKVYWNIVRLNTSAKHSSKVSPKPRPEFENAIYDVKFHHLLLHRPRFAGLSKNHSSLPGDVVCTLVSLVPELLGLRVQGYVLVCTFHGDGFVRF